MIAVPVFPVQPIMAKVVTLGSVLAMEAESSVGMYSPIVVVVLRMTRSLELTWNAEQLRELCGIELGFPSHPRRSME